MKGLARLCAVVGVSVLVGCAPAADPQEGAPTSPGPSPTEAAATPLPVPPEPALTMNEAAELLSWYQQTNEAALLAANESHDAAEFSAVDTGPMMLVNEFEVGARERLERPFEINDSWNHHVGQVWAPEAGDYPRYALTGSAYVHSPEEPAEEATEGREVLIGWIQDEPSGPWRKWASVEVDLRDLPEPVVEPVTGRTQATHREASDRLLAYLRGQDSPDVHPDERLEEFIDFTPADTSVKHSYIVAPVRNRIDPVGPAGSILATATSDGSLGVIAIRSVERFSVEGERAYIDVGEELRTVLDLPEYPRSIEERRLLTIAYLISDDGEIHVLGSTVRHIS